MVRKNSGISSVNDFKAGVSACTNLGTTTELNMRDFFNSKGIKYEPVTFEKADEVVAAYDAGRCDTYTCLLYTSPSPRDRTRSRMPSSA